MNRGSVTRLKIAFETAKESLSELEADATARLEAVDEKLSDWTCYYCMGSEGPMTASNCNVVVCGHGFHSLCAMRARQVASTQFRDALNFQADSENGPASEVIFGIRCGMCRYKFVGDDIIDVGFSAHRRLIGKCKVPSKIKGIPGTIQNRRKDLENGLERLEVAEKIIIREYNLDNMPPSVAPDCSIM